METKGTPIWSFMDANAIRPLDVFVGMQAQEVGSFIKGSQVIAAKVQHIQPDAIFIPERGARPFEWMIEAMRSPDSPAFNYLHLPIGTHADVDTSKLEGVKPHFKYEAIKGVVEHAIRDRGITFSRPLIIDEVQKGTTLSAATRYLLDIFKEKGIESVLHVIAAQDNRDGSLHFEKNEHYKDLLTNSNPQCEVSVITLPLVTTDRRSLLNTIIPPTEMRTRDNAPKMMMTVHNVDAQHTLEKLLWVANNSLETHRILEKIKAGDLQTEDLTDEGAKIFAWIQEVLTEPNTKNKHKSAESILNWFNNLLIYLERSQKPYVKQQKEENLR